MNKKHEDYGRVEMMQYKECWAYLRHLVGLQWQIPTATFTIIGALMTWIFQSNSSHYAKAIIVLTAAVFDLLMLIQMVKHRNGIDGVAAFKKHLEKEVFSVEEVPIETEHIFRFTEEQGRRYDEWKSRCSILFRTLAHRGAYSWFQGAMVLAFLFLTTLSILLWCDHLILYRLGAL